MGVFLKVVNAIRFAVVFCLIGFLGLVCYGIYTALDSATVGYSTNMAIAEPIDLGIEETIEAFLEPDNSSKTDNQSKSEDEPSIEPEVEVTTETSEIKQNTHQEKQSVTSGIAASHTSGKSINSAQNSTSDTSSNDKTQNSKPTKEKVWVEAQYEYINHPAQYETIEHPAEYVTVTEYYTVCSCEFKTQSSIYPHQDETGHTKYRTGVGFDTQVKVSEAWTETKLVSKAWTEKKEIAKGYWK